LARRLIKTGFRAVQNGPIGENTDSSCRVIAIVAAIVAPLVLFFILGHRYDVDAGEPAMKIDISATLGTERTQQDVGRLAANRANALGGLAGLGFNH
jgi:hypothetical protein